MIERNPNETINDTTFQSLGTLQQSRIHNTSVQYT